MKYRKNVIEAVMRLKQLKPGDIAKLADRTEDTVYKHIRGDRNSKRIEQTLEQVLNPELDEVNNIYLNK